MTQKQRKNKKRIILWILGISSFLLFLVLVLLQSSNLWKLLSVETATDILLLYALSSLNFVAFVIFAFIFIRNLLKLSRERSSLQLGSKIKTRLLAYFFAVSLMPIIAMAVFSYLFMNRAIERWFTNIPENVVRKAYQMQEEANSFRSSSFLKTAQFLAFMLESEKIDEKRLSLIASKIGLSEIVVLSKNDNVIVSSGPLEKEYIFPENGQTFQTENGQLVARCDFSDGRKLLIFSEVNSRWESEEMAERALEEFDRLKAQQITIRQIGLSTLGLLTLLLVFASGWIAFHLSRGLTVPIKALAEGANEIAKGNLSHRVNVFAEDELALLVNSFNQMAERLQVNARELQKGKEYIETVLESLSTGVISVNSEGYLTTMNKAAKKMLRLEDKDFSGMQLFSLIHRENTQVFAKILTRAKRTGKASEQTNLYRISNDGQTSESIPVALTATALPKKSGIVIVIEDLTELISAQRLAAWSEVARRMAHEIKNPLTPIQLSAERIARKFQEEVKHNSSVVHLEKIVSEGTRIILSEVKSLKSMVDEFSKFARLPSVRLEQKNLNDIVRRTILLYEDRNIEVKTFLMDVPDCMLDEEQLKQALVNLIDNAIEAFEESQEEKRIVIRTFFDERESKIIIEVSDNASGIDPKLFPKLFQPYFSTKDGGTGLGLTIVNRIIKEHSGRITVHRNHPKGTKFRIEIPAS